MSPSVRSGEVAEVSSQLADALSHRDLDGVETAAGALDELAAASEAEKSAARPRTARAHDGCQGCKRAQRAGRGPPRIRQRAWTLKGVLRWHGTFLTN